MCYPGRGHENNITSTELYHHLRLLHNKVTGCPVIKLTEDAQNTKTAYKIAAVPMLQSDGIRSQIEGGAAKPGVLEYIIRTFVCICGDFQAMFDLIVCKCMSGEPRNEAS